MIFIHELDKINVSKTCAQSKNINVAIENLLDPWLYEYLLLTDRGNQRAQLPLSGQFAVIWAILYNRSI